MRSANVSSVSPSKDTHKSIQLARSSKINQPLLIILFLGKFSIAHFLNKKCGVKNSYYIST